MFIAEFAKRLPYPIKQPLRYIYGFVPPSIHYGKVFWETYHFLQESQWWSREKLEEYQMQQLSNLLHHAYENVPYYRRVFDERGLKPEDIRDLSDMRRLPYLTKEIIQQNLSDLVGQNYPKEKLQYVTTGGTTGIPLGFYAEKGVFDDREWAFMLTQWNRVGFKMDERCVVLRGNIVSSNNGKFWKYGVISRNLILSSYHMTDQTLPKYVSKIRQFKPSFIQAYPSAISILARFMKENNIEPFPNIKALLCGSENLYSWQRQLLEQVFQCRVYSWYGHSERAVLAGECEKSTCYHIFPEYGFMELIANNGQPVSNEGEIGEVVATGFNNYVMPFIRFKTQDVGVYSTRRCNCGRNYPLMQRVEGRLQDYFVSFNGDLVPLTGGTDGLILEVSENVRKAQFCQDRRGHATLKLVKKDSYNEHDTVRIQDALRRRYGIDLSFEIEFVEDILLSPRGKFRFLIQKLPIEFSEA